MRTLQRTVLALGGLAALVAAAALAQAGFRLTGPTRSEGVDVAARTSSPKNPPARVADDFPRFSSGGFESAGYPTACRFTGPIADRGSIEQVRAAIATRAERGIAALRAELDGIPLEDAGRSVQTLASIAYLHMYRGEFAEAASWVERALEAGASSPRGLRANLKALLGVIHLRRGETENCLECLGPSSCILPIAPDAVHLKPSGSREAARWLAESLADRPDDMGVRWLLNVARMTLGEYPEGVPEVDRIPLDRSAATGGIGRFENVAQAAGLTVRGANQAGGSIADDFTGDGRPDLLTTSFDTDLGASLFVNRGDGTFEDRSESSGLAAQPLAVNCSQADFDNDGRLDAVLVRGGWEDASRLTLLRNLGDGRFEDVTIAAGLGEPIASHSAAWGDFDNDGHVDLFVCGEYAAVATAGLFKGDQGLAVADPRNRCRLYRNNGDGTFVDVAAAAGVQNGRYAKGAAWGDFDGDGFRDLYVSNFGDAPRLYHNDGDGTFTDLAPALGINGPTFGFSCWFFDLDNDGRLDIFANDYAGTMHEWGAQAAGKPTVAGHPRLYRNLGPDGFRDVSAEVGLDRLVLAMGSNFGDVDDDGFLDAYLATGLPGYSALVPNVLYRNAGGRRFEDVSLASGTAHLQKGHGVSFADLDGDGDLDLFVETGGAVPGDRAFNLLFRNPGHGRNRLKLKLVGTRTNRAALGATIRVALAGSDGQTRTVFREVGGGSSYGGNTLVESIGLGDAIAVESVTVTWPASRTTQTFRDLPVDRTVELTEGSGTPRVLDRSGVGPAEGD